MKKGWLLFILVFATGIFHIITAQQPVVSNDEQRKQMEQNKIKTLVAEGLYDSALSYCATLRKQDKLGYSELETALANIYWHKGDKHTAYQYVLNHVDYNLKLLAGDNAFSSMLYDYEYSYSLATDSFLENVVTDKIRDFYLKQDFPEVATGLKFVMLKYQLNKCMERYHYDLTHQKDSAQRIALRNQYEERVLEIKERFLDIIREHNRLLTWKEAGSGAQSQFSFIYMAKDADLHRQLIPFFEKAFHDKSITPEVYVSELVERSEVLTPGINNGNKLQDSLCTVYGCSLSTKKVIITDKGDTIVYYESDNIRTAPQKQ
jgi:hypothetical protein